VHASKETVGGKKSGKEKNANAGNPELRAQQTQERRAEQNKVKTPKSTRYEQLDMQR